MNKKMQVKDFKEMAVEEINKDDFVNEYGQKDWNSILWYVFIHQGEGLTNTKWAKVFGVHPVTFANKWSGFKTFAETSEGNPEFFSSAVARQSINNKKNQYKLSIERREINKMIREESLTDLVLENIIIPNIKPYTPKKINTKVATNDTTQMFFITDLHYRDAITSEGLKDISSMIINNWDKSKTIRIIWGGDYIENRHHNDQVRKSASALQQSQEVADIIARCILDVIVNTGAEVHSSFIIGNHDTIRQGNEKGQDNLEEHIVGVIQNTVDLLLKENKKYFTIGEPAYEQIEELGEHTYNFRHGHIGNWSDKSIMKNIINEELQLDRKFDRYVFGHFHRWNDWQKKGVSKRFIIAPSMKTWDGNFENANLLRNTTGIVTFRENGDIIKISWKGKKIKDGELK